MSERSFGDVTAEYLALRQAAGLVSGQHEAVVVKGSDSLSFLQSLLSQDLDREPGSVVRSFLLSPQGKLRALLWALIGDQQVILIVDHGFGEQVAADLGRYRIRVDAEIELDERPIHEMWGPDSARVLESVGMTLDDGWIAAEANWVASIPLGGLDRYLFIGDETGPLVAAGAVRCGDQAVTAVRVEAGEPVMGLDVDESTIPQESGLVPDSVSFEKGCYLGQELVARIDSRGRVNRTLRGLVLGENLLPPHSAEVLAGERVVGTLGSVAESLSLRAPVALAVLRREVESGSTVVIGWLEGSVQATVRDLPLDDFTDS